MQPAGVQGKKQGWNKEQLLLELAKIPGVYVPSFYDVTYREDGRIEAVTPNRPGVPARVTKAIVRDMDSFTPPEDFVVPLVGAVQDRACVEVLRGCVRGCRFCQAGFLYRPMRQRDASLLNKAAQDLCANTGYEELSLSSLSTSDHGQLEELLEEYAAARGQEFVHTSYQSSVELMADIEIVVDRIADMRIQDMNTVLEAARQKVMKEYAPDEMDVYMRTLEVAQINETDYFSHIIHEDMDDAKKAEF